MDKLNGGYWDVSGERRSRKRTQFFIEENKSPNKSSKKRSIEDIEKTEGSESNSPPHKRSKVTHQENADSFEISNDYDDQNTDPNIQSCNSLAYEPLYPKILVSRPDLASDANNEETQAPMDATDTGEDNLPRNIEESTSNEVIKNEALNPTLALSEHVTLNPTLALALPSLEKEFDSPVKEIKFSFPTEDSEATQPTDQPSLDADVSIQTDGHSGLTNSISSAQNITQPLLTSNNSMGDVAPSEVPKVDVAPIITHEDSSDILLVNNASVVQESTAAVERKKTRVIEDTNSQPVAMEVENESQIIDEIAEANDKEVVTIHSNQLVGMQETAKTRVNLGSDLKSDVSVKEELSEISKSSSKEIDLRGSNPKIVATNDKSKPKPVKKKSEKVDALRQLVKNNYAVKDYRKFMDTGKSLKPGGEKDYCAALVSVLRSNEKIMHEYIAHLPPKIQQMCVDAMHSIAMEQSDESEVHELSQDMINNADRPATRSTTGPLVFGLQKQILENPDIAAEVLPAWRGDFVAAEDDYGMTENSAGLDAPRADNWSTPTSKKQKENKLSALQKLKADKENAKNKPKVVPKASNRPTKYVMPRFGEEERIKKKNNKISAGGYNIDAGYEDSDESDSDQEDTVPDEDPVYDLALPAYGPEFIEDDFAYGYQGDMNSDLNNGGAGRAPKSPTKKSSSHSKNSSSSPSKEPKHNHPHNNRHSSTDTSPKKTSSSSNLSHTNARSNNGNNGRSNNTTPTKGTSSVNTKPTTVNYDANMGYSNVMPAVPVQSTLERSFFSNPPRSNSGGANDLPQRAQATNNNTNTNNTNINNNNNSNNNTNVVALDSSPLGKTNQPQVPAANIHTSPVAPVQPYNGPKIKIYLKIPTLANKKTIVTYATEDNNGVPTTVAQLKEYISKLNNIEVTALMLGEYQLGNDDDAVRDLLSPADKEEVTVEAKDVKKTILASYKEKCVIDGVPPNDLLVKMLEGVNPPKVYLNQKGLIQVRDMQILSTCIEPNIIEILNLSQNTLGTPILADLERLLVRQNKSLRSLHLSDCSLADPTVFQALTTLNNLQELNISQNLMSDNLGVQFMAVLPNLANLTNLDISRCNFGPSTMKALEDSRFCDNGIYPQNKGLTTVSASFNKLQSVGVNHLVAALCQRTSTSLLALKLQQVEISESDQNHCAKSLHRLMSLKNARLADLDLSNNLLTSRMNWISQGINDSTYLHTIRLNKCSLNADSLTCITDVLQFSQSLTCLELSDNIFGKSGADIIANVLQKRHKLVQLKLNNCGLTSVGILTILRACSGQNVNFNVTRLELENNCDLDFSRLKYGDRNLTDAFSKLNATLAFLDLSKNGINDEDVRNALKQSWEEIHGKEQVSVFASSVSLRFMKKQKKN